MVWCASLIFESREPLFFQIRSVLYPLFSFCYANGTYIIPLEMPSGCSVLFFTFFPFALQFGKCSSMSTEMHLPAHFFFLSCIQSTDEFTKGILHPCYSVLISGIFFSIPCRRFITLLHEARCSCMLSSFKK